MAANARCRECGFPLYEGECANCARSSVLTKDSPLIADARAVEDRRRSEAARYVQLWTKGLITTVELNDYLTRVIATTV